MSSKRAIRRKAERRCSQKQAYVSHEAANAQSRFMLSRYGEHLDAYRCKVANHWHVGHAPMVVQVRLGRVV